MRTFLTIVVLLLIAAGLVLALASTRPATLSVRRDILIRATPAKIFALLADFHRWKEWAPQDRDDPSMTRTYQGPSEGLGAVSEWQSRGNSGAGRMEITAASPPLDLTITVDFVRPFAAHNINRFELTPMSDGTRVTWTMTGTNVFAAKVMSLFVKMDKMIGRHFERGLANLKAAAEQ